VSAGMNVPHGYTLADLDGLARRVVSSNRHWWPAGDRDEQHAIAWHGIAERLCASEGAPSEHDLLDAGRRALASDVRTGITCSPPGRSASNRRRAHAKAW
jgi:hypothetical protein